MQTYSAASRRSSLPALRHPLPLIVRRPAAQRQPLQLCLQLLVQTQSVSAHPLHSTFQSTLPSFRFCDRVVSLCVCVCVCLCACVVMRYSIDRLSCVWLSGGAVQPWRTQPRLLQCGERVDDMICSACARLARVIVLATGGDRDADRCIS